MTLIEKCNSTLDDHCFFRFRPYNALTCKELLYNEMFFYSKNEVNDPFDLSANLIIPKGKSKVIEYFIESAFKGTRSKNGYNLFADDYKVVKHLASILSTKTNNISDLLDISIYELFNKAFEEYKITDISFPLFWKYFSRVFLNLQPNNLHGVSFAKNYRNMLLWSIYADKHEGFCEIFQLKNDTISLRNITSETYNDYDIKNVEYKNNKDIDLSLMFNDDGEMDLSLLFQKYLPVVTEKAYLTKSNEWGNEQEFRIFENTSVQFSTIDEQKEDNSLQNKLYYFNEEQLLGVIVGANMKKNHIEEIKWILENKKTRKMIYQSIPKGNQVEVVINNIYSGKNVS